MLFGDARRTLIHAEKKAVAEVKVADEPVTVIISAQGWARARQGHGHDAAAFAFKAGDGLYAAFECRSVDHLLIFGSDGRVYSAPVIGNNEEILFFQAIDEMMGHQYANVQQRVQATGKILDKG